MSKVNLDVMKPWITKRLHELLGIEDDVVIEFVFNQLDEKVCSSEIDVGQFERRTLLISASRSENDANQPDRISRRKQSSAVHR